MSILLIATARDVHSVCFHRKDAKAAKNSILITTAVKYPTLVIPAKAGIQKESGCPRLATYRGRLIKLVPDLVGDPA